MTRRTSKVPRTRAHVDTSRTCTRLLGVVWADRGFWRRPAARRFECGGQMRLVTRRYKCPVCTNLAGEWKSQPAPRTVFTLTRRRRERALQAALRAGGARVSVCPTPWKAAYGSRQEAKSTLGTHRHARPKGQLRPYSCKCGYWHLTSMSRNVLRLVKKRKRQP